MYRHIEKDKKELTDEEIVKALEKTYVLGKFRPEIIEKTLKLIYRWQTEIKRLNKVETELQELNAKYYNDAKDLRRENAELQKQVDELKERLHMIFALGFDYDGCDKAESLKGLIDELVKITQMDSKEFAEYYKGVEVE